jgi:hypothetical protein
MNQNQNQKAIAAIRTYNSSQAAARVVYRKLSNLGRGWQVGFYGDNHPELEKLKRRAYKAMLFAYKGDNMYYKNQLRLAVIGCHDGHGFPALWQV